MPVSAVLFAITRRTIGPDFAGLAVPPGDLRRDAIPAFNAREALTTQP